MKVSENSSAPVLILTPTGRDATLAAEALADAGVASEICRDLAQLSARIGEDAAAVLLAEEALSAAELPQLLERLRAQPAWSDLPLLILTSAGQREDTASVEILKLFGPSGNVTLLERPLRSVVLVSTVQVALRARRRQYEVRNLIEERETVLASISDAFSALDRDWRYIHVNDKVAELAGWPKEKMVGRVIWEIFPEAVGTEFYENCAARHAHRRAAPWRIFLCAVEALARHADVSDQGRDSYFPRRYHRAEKAGTAGRRNTKRNCGKARNACASPRKQPTSGRSISIRAPASCNSPSAAGNSSAFRRSMKVTYETYLAGVHPDDRHIVHETVQRVRQPGSTGRFDIEYRTIGLADGKERWVAERGRAVLDADGEM